MRKAKRITWIKADGTIEVSSAVDTFELLQKLVGGYIETIPYFKSYNGKTCIAYANDSGRINGLPLNRAATDAWHAVQNILTDPIHGDVVIVQRRRA